MTSSHRLTHNARFKPLDPWPSRSPTFLCSLSFHIPFPLIHYRIKCECFAPINPFEIPVYHNRGTFFPELFKNSMSLGNAEVFARCHPQDCSKYFYVLFGALSSFLCYSEFPSKKSIGGKYDLIESCVFFIIKTIRFTNQNCCAWKLVRCTQAIHTYTMNIHLHCCYELMFIK